MAQSELARIGHSQTGGKPAAKLGQAAFLLNEDVLAQKRNTAQRTGSRRARSSLRKGFHDGVDLRIDRGDSGQRGLREFGRTDFTPADKFGETDSIEARIFIEGHRSSAATAVILRDLHHRSGCRRNPNGAADDG